MLIVFCNKMYCKKFKEQMLLGDKFIICHNEVKLDKCVYSKELTSKIANMDIKNEQHYQKLK